ncbi:MAG TPA: HEAT repeat domain-containing protein [Phycisphaerales bacterium]|nr:HEAT repeat domain-containing protein [Phycisphaerales bacterium]
MSAFLSHACLHRLCAISLCLVGIALCVPAFSQTRNQPQSAPAADAHFNVAQTQSHAPALTLASASDLERQTIQSLLQSDRWVKRAVAAVRLERFTCPQSADDLIKLLADPSPFVRAFAIRALAIRKIPQAPNWLLNEEDPAVIRAALRNGFTIDSARIVRGVQALLRMDDLRDKLIGVEIAAASSIPALVEPATQTARTIILRMDRMQAGAFSPRLCQLTGAPDPRKPYEWENWILKIGRRFKLHSGPLNDLADRLPLDDSIAALSSEDFASLETYMQELGQSPLDLAICIDTTASMSDVLSAAQAGMDDLMLFARNSAADARLGVVAYRDRRDKYETLVFDLTDDLERARTQLWSLDADGGGDTPESVYKGLHHALASLSWREDSRKVLILIGDAPPHVGEGELCVDLARRAHALLKLTTHCIAAEGKPVKFFDEIAEVGHGRVVNLKDESDLVAQIVGLSLGDRFDTQFREFFQMYLQLCR